MSAHWSRRRCGGSRAGSRDYVIEDPRPFIVPTVDPAVMADRVQREFAFVVWRGFSSSAESGLAKRRAFSACTSRSAQSSAAGVKHAVVAGFLAKHYGAVNSGPGAPDARLERPRKGVFPHVPEK